MKIQDQRISLVFGEIERREDVLASRIFRNSKSLVSSNLWPTLDVIVRHHKQLAEKEKLLSAIERKILSTVESDGPIRTDVLRQHLRLEGKEHNYKFHRSLANLENYSFIVGAEDPKPEKHLHANVWQTWEERTGKIADSNDLSYTEAVEQLLAKSIETCVLANELQIRKWFPWKHDTEAAKAELLRKRTIARINSHLLKRETVETLSRSK